jgi:hypothetical protein
MNTEFTSIVRAFQKTGEPWAVTGSWAIKLHAEKAGLQPHRPPRDFDFAVAGSNFDTFIRTLQSLGYTFESGPPLITPKRVPDRVTMVKGPFEVDLLKAGGRLAPSLHGRTVYKNIPVASVSNMMQHKKNILETLNNGKARANLNFLNALDTWNNTSKKSRPFGLERVKGPLSRKLFV